MRFATAAWQLYHVSNICFIVVVTDTSSFMSMMQYTPEGKCARKQKHYNLQSLGQQYKTKNCNVLWKWRHKNTSKLESGVKYKLVDELSRSGFLNSVQRKGQGLKS